ncbi:MAG: CBS domain-containing protein [Candidatus Brocadia sp.]|nr:CBS domain-containing protein [Candidatus Brocadia sp.]MDG6025321.1 CBS domain-containing protein [Candidatus Brocadia sp.]
MTAREVVAKDIMTKTLIAAKKEATGRHLAEKMLSGSFSGMPVVDGNNKLIGVVSEFDLIKAMEYGKPLDKVTAEEIMTKKPVSVSEDTTVEDIIHVMTKQNIMRVPVVKNDIPIGIVSRCDVLKCVYGVLKPEFIKISSERGEVEFFAEISSSEKTTQE